MKKTNLTILLRNAIATCLLFLVSSMTVWAQAPKHTRWAEVREQDSLKLDNIVRNAPVVFEGIRISGEPMGKIINGFRYTSSIVRVGHVYRGSGIEAGQLVEVQRNSGWKKQPRRTWSHGVDPDRDTSKSGGYGSEDTISIYFVEPATMQPMHDYSQKNAEVIAFETFEKQGSSIGVVSGNSFRTQNHQWRTLEVFRNWFYQFPDVTKYIETSIEKVSSPKKPVGGGDFSENVQKLLPPSIDSIRSVRSVRLKQPKLNIRAGFGDTLLVYGKNFTNNMNVAFFNVQYDTDYFKIDYDFYDFQAFYT